MPDLPKGKEKRIKSLYQKLNTLASAAISIKCGPPSKIIFEKNFASST
jgi:hypothetical protein